MNTIGERLKYIRTLKNITLNQLAENTGLSKGNLSSYENNKFKPSSDAVILICNFLEISSDWLLMGKDSDNTVLTEFEKNVLHFFGQLPKNEQEDIAEFIMIKYKKLSKKGQSSTSMNEENEEVATKELA